MPDGERVLDCAGRRLTFGHTRIMGVLNITPDSFSDGGSLYSGGRVCIDSVRARAESMLTAGADILDVGGESTRPGAVAVDAQEELRRVMPVLDALADLDTIVSVDTTKPTVAKAALDAGCGMINDVTGLADPRMIEAIAASDAAVCIMHMQGEPRTMQQNPSYPDVVAEVQEMLHGRVEQARAMGIADQRLSIDPGFGFGKTVAHNLALLRALAELRIDELPLVVGLSRKRMIGALTGASVEARMPGSVALAVLAAERGADIVRVHDVAETDQALKILEATRASDE